jgi:RimJ/RimL family protein N-acetyltransferase
VLRPQYPIETDRLLLRPLTADDLDDVYEYDRRPDVARYLYWEPRTRAQSRLALDRNTRRTALEKEGDALVLAVVRRELGRVVGQVSLGWVSQEHRGGEIGFILDPAHHGRGLAREAVEAMLRLGFADLGLHRIVGQCDARNHASARLMERLGMRREAHLVANEHVKGEWTDGFVYAILAGEWRARCSQADSLA